MSNGFINESKDNAAQGVDPAFAAPGLPVGSPDENRAIQNAMRIRGGDIARGGLMGAAYGAQAAQGSMNPLAAFIQGAAAGLQAPAQVYAQKQAQIKSALDATPFGEVVPEAKNPDSPFALLAGMPYGLASKAIQGIAQEVMKARVSGEEARKTEAVTDKVTEQTAQGYAEIYRKTTGKSIDPSVFVGMDEGEVSAYVKSGGIDTSKVFTDEQSLRKEFYDQVTKEEFISSRDNYKNIKDAAKSASETSDLKSKGAADVKLLYSYIKMIDPGSVVREGEVRLTQQGMSIPDRIITAYKNAYSGVVMSDEFRKGIVRQAEDSWRNKVGAFKTMVTTYRDLAKSSGFNPNQVVINVGGILDYADPNRPDPLVGGIVSAPEVAPAQIQSAPLGGGKRFTRNPFNPDTFEGQ